MTETMSWSKRIDLIKTTFLEFFKEHSLFHGAALSYYSLLALVPVLYLSVTYIGMFIGHDVMLNVVTSLLEDRVGLSDASGVIGFLDEVNLKGGNTFLHVFGILALLFSCSVIFNSLKRSINEFYNIRRENVGRKKWILSSIFSRLLSMGFIIGLTILLVVLYFAETLFMSLNNKFFDDLETLNWLFSIVARHGLPILTNLIVFSVIFKYLNDGRVKWKIAIRGGLVTSVLLYLGQLLIKYYLSHYFFAASGGTAGTMLIILVWVYYFSQIIFFGAKFVAVLSRFKGVPIKIRD